jgi:enamine deaminase RidA (YjgF/YER057c/UK114 family)
MSYEAKIKELGLTIPEAPKPVAAYVPAVRSGNLVYTAGQIPFLNGELKYKGKLGKELTVEEGYEAAKLCALNCLSVIKGVIGDLDKIVRIVRVGGFVNSVPEFSDQPKVVNGASELFGQIFAEAGKHARAAVGSINLPMNAAVEVEVIVEVKD